MIASAGTGARMATWQGGQGEKNCSFWSTTELEQL